RRDRYIRDDRVSAVAEIFDCGDQGDVEVALGELDREPAGNLQRQLDVRGDALQVVDERFCVQVVHRTDANRFGHGPPRLGPVHRSGAIRERPRAIQTGTLGSEGITALAEGGSPKKEPAAPIGGGRQDEKRADRLQVPYKPRRCGVPLPKAVYRPAGGTSSEK